MIRKTTLALCLLLLPLAVSARDNTRTYVIKKGDTLWGISQRFLADPYYWPNLWANNPDLKNPHFIYPGQKLEIYDGRIEVVAVAPEAEEMPAEKPQETAMVPPAAEMTEAAEAVTITTEGGAEGFISTDELDSAGILVDTVDNRILMAEGDRVFVKMNDLGAASVGDTFALFETGKTITHPRTGETIGYQVISIGTLELAEINEEVATATITDSFREIERGARLRRLEPPRREIELRRSTRELSGTLVASKGDQITLGQHDIVYIDLGTEDGLEAGNLLYISRPREATKLALEEGVKLPDILLGSAIVIQTYPRTATALVLKSSESLFRGDRISTVTE